MADRKSMAMLDRYKKTGGFLQLVCLLETSPAVKQEKFLTLIAEESPAWESELKKRLLSFDRIMNWNSDVLGDIWPRLPEKVVATAVWNLPADQKEKFFATTTVAFKRKLDEVFSMNAPTEGEILSCQLKILQEIRGMSQSGLLRMDKVDPGATIPDKIEDELNDPAGTLPGSWEKKVTSTSPGEPSASPAAVMLVEEMKDLRRKLQGAASEIQNLKAENQLMREKLEQIKKIA